jgi:hypothetical protein
MKTILTDSKKTITAYFLSFISPILLKLEGFISLYQQLFNTKSTMNTLQIFELIALPFFFLGVFWYFDKKFKAIKEDLKNQSQILRDDSHEIDMYLSTVNNRKAQYLYNCIKSNAILPEPEKWMTKEEERLHSKNSNERAEILESINERLNKN